METQRGSSTKQLIFTIEKINIMKKLVFAAVAALVMVSVGNVFAQNEPVSTMQSDSISFVAPADTVVTTDSDDTVNQPAEPADQPAETEQTAE